MPEYTQPVSGNLRNPLGTASVKLSTAYYVATHIDKGVVVKPCISIFCLKTEVLYHLPFNCVLLNVLIYLFYLLMLYSTSAEGL